MTQQHCWHQTDLLEMPTSYTVLDAQNDVAGAKHSFRSKFVKISVIQRVNSPIAGFGDVSQPGDAYVRRL